MRDRAAGNAPVVVAAHACRPTARRSRASSSQLTWLACLLVSGLAIQGPAFVQADESMVVSVAELATRLTDPDLVLLHVGDRAEYEQAHIPGARHVALSDISVSDRSSTGLALELPPADQLHQRLVALGITDRSRIVVYYGKDWISPATRVLFTLDHAGLGGRTALLDGGQPAWTRAGHPVTAEVPQPRQGDLSPLRVRSLVVDAEFVRAHLQTSGYAVVDARTTPFYEGTQTGGPKQRPHRPGHIAFARSVPFTEIADEQLMLRPVEQLRALFTKAGVKPGDTVVAYCHIGQQATAVVFAARRLGHPVLLYDGSFEDWSRRDAFPVEAPAASVPPADDAFRADTRAYLARLEKLGFAGVLVVARDGTPIVAEGVGQADRERGTRWTPATVSTIGSITKQFTAAAILALEEEGKLRVEDTLAAHFGNVPEDKRAITLHQLLSHSSGIVDPEQVGDFDPIGRDEYVRKVLLQPLVFQPGAGYEYSNANYSLLGAIVEQLTGRSWERFARERLWLPQGMYETGYLLAAWGEGRLAQGYRRGERWGTVIERPMAPDGPYWALRANGGVHATAFDMLRWAEALQKGRVLSPASMEKLWAPHVKEPGDTHYGYGWSIQQFGGAKVVTHNGGNGIHFADLAIVPATRIVAFLQTNVVADLRMANGLLRQVGSRLLAGQAYPTVPDVIPMSESDLRAFEGVYRLPADAGHWRVAVAGDRLTVVPGGQRAFALLHSAAELDPGRAASLCESTNAFVGASVRGDFEPMRALRRDEATATLLAERFDEWRKEREAEFGRLEGHEVLGTARQAERDVTVVRFRFERGTVDRAYVWSHDAEPRLLGVSQRGLDSALPFVPTGASTFASWDGGQSPSRPLTFARGSDGTMRATFDGRNGVVNAVR